MSFENRKLIVKRIVRPQQVRAHKGAWKIAYADFVTAMMAFFLLMWLLSATTERQRKGLSDYFSPSVSISKVSTGGDGLLYGEELRESASRSDNKAQGNIDLNVPLERELEREIAQIFASEAKQSAEGQGFSTQLVVKPSNEGLVIELFDLEDYPLFYGAGDRLTPRAMMLIGLLAQLLHSKGKQFAVNGHLRSLPDAFAPIDSWRISFDRAVAVQRELLQKGIPARDIKRLTGYADRRHAVADPVSVRNNRIEIIVLENNR